MDEAKARNFNDGKASSIVAAKPKEIFEMMPQQKPKTTMPQFLPRNKRRTKEQAGTMEDVDGWKQVPSRTPDPGSYNSTLHNSSMGTLAHGNDDSMLGLANNISLNEPDTRN